MLYERDRSRHFFFHSITWQSLNSTWNISKASKLIATQNIHQSKQALNETALRSKGICETTWSVRCCCFSQGQISSCPLLACQAKNVIFHQNECLTKTHLHLLKWISYGCLLAYCNYNIYTSYHTKTGANPK